MNKDRDQNRPPGGEGPPNEQAAAWVVRLASDQRTRGDEEAFAEWMAKDPGNADDYLDHAELWNGVAALADDDEARAILGAPRPDISAPADEPARELPLPFRGLAPEKASSGGRSFGANGRERGLRTRRTILAGFALAAAASAAYVTLPGLLTPTPDLYETAIGEQRRLLLADGSAITLNTDSALRVELTDSERRLFLDRGQAHFQVARDAARPFRVFVGNDEVRALGTAFEVWRIGETAKVTLEEGTVAIYRGTGVADLHRSARPGERLKPVGPLGPRPAALLQPGQQVEVGPDVRLAAREVDIASTRAWRSGRMILDDVPLGQVIADINRYGGRRIVLADPALERLRVSGVFHTSQPEALVDGVTAALPVRLARQNRETLVLEPR